MNRAAVLGAELLWVAQEMWGKDCRLGGTEELSCDAFLQSVQDNPICPLDLK